MLKLKKRNYYFINRKKTSLFKSGYKATADSLAILAVKKSVENPVNGQIIINGGLLPRAKFKPEVYYSNEKLIIYNQILRDKYNFEAPNKIIWKIEEQTKTIQGYTCRKATTKYGSRLITAWYTEKTPIQEGPYTFKGLPGLILEAYDSKGYFNFSLVGLKYVKTIPSIPYSITTTYEKFHKKRKDMMEIH
ncbi:GLPGLI family protein [Chryseobacterium sp. FH2]|uniref:GLPGLI family protein n=1 Tax=Chryseobacterium sp. FH2 TaxID=1674291 RepID=UPI00065AA79B|nr:GLPGLI family protein [Chryseobacterium sp. FH2]